MESCQVLSGCEWSCQLPAANEQALFKASIDVGDGWTGQIVSRGFVSPTASDLRPADYMRSEKHLNKSQDDQLEATAIHTQIYTSADQKISSEDHFKNHIADGGSAITRYTTFTSVRQVEVACQHVSIFLACSLRHT
jgi:hypothetical protein